MIERESHNCELQQRYLNVKQQYRYVTVSLPLEVMSLVRLVFTQLHWAEISYILEFLSIRDVWRLGCTNRSAFVTFLREKSLRKHYSLGLHNPTARFLSKYSNHHKVLLASYPRSGNSFVRQLLELETGIITGSDSRPNRTLASQLLQCGYRGEGITDNSVWVVKTHYPERLGCELSSHLSLFMNLPRCFLTSTVPTVSVTVVCLYTLLHRYLRFYISRMILVVRNPFDAIESYFHMGLTNTHDKTLTTEVQYLPVTYIAILSYFVESSIITVSQTFESLRSIWTEFVENEASIWSRFHHYWIGRIEQERIPALVLRYEDLLEHREVCTFYSTRWSFLKTVIDPYPIQSSPVHGRWCS